MPLVDPPTAQAVADYLGLDLTSDPNQATLVASRLANVITTTRAYCRGKGFDGDGQVVEDIAGVILSATAREVNVSPGVVREEIGGYNATFSAMANGFSLRELAVLNAYRRMAT